MLKFRASLALALCGALLSALCFGAGIGTVPLMFSVMLNPDAADGTQTLAELLTAWNETRDWLIPDSLIAIAPTDQFKSVLTVLGAVFALTVVGATGKFIHSYFAMSAGIRTVSMLREQAFRRIIHLPMRLVIVDGTADRISRIVKDTNRLRAGFNAITTKAIGESLKAVAAISVAVYHNWQLSCIALIGAPILAITIRKFSKKVQKASKRALKQSGAMLGAMTEAVQGIRVVKVHTAENFEDERFQTINNKLMDEELSMRLAKALSSPVVEFISMVGVILIAIMSAWYIINSEIAYGNVFATLIGVAAAGAAVRPLAGVSTDVHESAAAAERLAHLLDEPMEVQQSPNLPALADHAHSIRFNDISFTYPGADCPTLKNISLDIQHGETVAFVGPNGSGKTTLLSLIPRLFDPNTGDVQIDDISLSDVQLKSLRDQIGVVTQETVVFHDTIANNIAYGASASVTSDQIKRAAEHAHADAFIQRKPNGYQTMVGEQGTTLSGGERQRIAIARAILRNPRIIILDEATSMIDAESEAMIASALEAFCQDRTSLVIAHRLSTVVNADRIVVLRHGEINDIGTHTELLQRCSLYQQLCRTQLVDHNGNGTESKDGIDSAAVATASSPSSTPSPMR